MCRCSRVHTVLYVNGLLMLIDLSLDLHSHAVSKAWEITPLQQRNSVHHTEPDQQMVATVLQPSYFNNPEHNCGKVESSS